MFLIIRSLRPARLAVVLTREELDALRSGEVSDLLLVDVSTGIVVALVQQRRNAIHAFKAAYRDPTCPEALCERCGAPYRGPALYCSLQCAEEDA